MNELAKSLSHLAEEVANRLATVQSAGHNAFDTRDPNAAIQQAEELRKVTEAQQILQRLGEILGVDPTPKPVPASEPRTRKTKPPASVPFEPDSEKTTTRPRAKTATINGRQRGGNQGINAVNGDGMRQEVHAALSTLGGAGSLTQVKDAALPFLKPRLNQIDYELMEGGQGIRWRYNVAWALTTLKNEGVVENYKHGHWRLTPAGANIKAIPLLDPDIRWRTLNGNT